MKLRETVPKYDVYKHGQSYVEPISNIVAVCPECYSTNVERHLTKSLYTCNDCNCKFFMDMNTRLTKKGKFLQAFMFVLSILFFCAIFVVYVGAILWLDSMEKELGAEFVQDTYALPTGIFSIIGMIVLGVLGWKCMSISYEI